MAYGVELVRQSQCQGLGEFHRAGMKSREGRTHEMKEGYNTTMMASTGPCIRHNPGQALARCFRLRFPSLLPLALVTSLNDG